MKEHTSEALLGNSGNSVTRSAADVSEDVLVDGRLVLLVRLCAGTVHGDDTDIVRGKTPDGECPPERSNPIIVTHQHTEGSEGILLLASGLALDRGDTFLYMRLLGLRGDRLQLDLEQLVLVLDPLCDLLAAESKLPRTILEVQNRGVSLRRYLTADGKDTLAGRGNRATSLIPVR